jgi:hypothetical protein
MQTHKLRDGRVTESAMSRMGGRMQTHKLKDGRVSESAMSKMEEGCRLTS